jgi:hypothetical protein
VFSSDLHFLVLVRADGQQEGDGRYAQRHGKGYQIIGIHPAQSCFDAGQAQGRDDPARLEKLA